MTVRRALRLLAVAVVVASVVVALVGWRQRGEALAAREEARVAGRDDQRAVVASEAQTARIERFIAANEGAATRDRAGAERISTAIEELTSLRARLADAQDAIVTLSTLSDEQVRQIGVLRACVTALDGARAALEEGSPEASAFILEGGRRSCRRAEELADGIVAAVHPYDFPDPSVIEVDGTYYAFATNGPAGTVQVLTSRDLSDWSIAGSALAGVASWARPGFTWAPSVARVPGGFALYYAVRDRASERQCIGVATSTAPQGPYVDRTTAPLVCPRDHGGAIDARPFRDEEGHLYLTWKTEGETVGGAAQLWAQPLDPGGTRRAWFPVPLLQVGREWEGRTVEAPSMVRIDGTWLLIYSGNAWNSDRYAVGYATCAGPIGPCTRPEGDNVLLRSDEAVAGPGGAEVFRRTDGRWGVAYAGWAPGAVGQPHPRRLHTGVLTLTPDGPAITAG